MSTDRRLAELFDVATADVPGASLAPPLAAIHARVRRRRRMLGAVTAAAVAAVLAGGYSVSSLMFAEPTPKAPIVSAASPTAASAPVLPWISAMVARDDSKITVYTGVERCTKLDRPRARITAQDAARVTVGVTGRVVPADDCSVGRIVVPVVVTLPGPLGERKLVDASGQRSHPTYFERYLPDLRQAGRWSPVGGNWFSDDVNWYGVFNGPGGSELRLQAQLTESVRQRDPVSTMDLGPYKGTITSNSAKMWTVWWQAGDATYSLRILPAEGESLTLTAFKREVARLWT